MSVAGVAVAAMALAALWLAVAAVMVRTGRAAMAAEDDA